MYVVMVSLMVDMVFIERYFVYGRYTLNSYPFDR